MSQYYTIAFPNGSSLVSGLSPTMITFMNLVTGTSNAAPAISEIATNTGMYQFQYGTTQPIYFLADAATTSPGAGRYVFGQLDPSDRIDYFGTSILAIGNTSVAIGTTTVAQLSNEGTTLVAIGNTSIAYGGTILADLVNQGLTLVAIGNTTAGIGTSLTVVVAGIGSTASFIGNSSTYPVDLFGYMMRLDALLEGQQQFTKGSGLLNMYDLTGATLLSARTITNSASLVTKQ